MKKCTCLKGEISDQAMFDGSQEYENCGQPATHHYVLKMPRTRSFRVGGLWFSMFTGGYDLVDCWICPEHLHRFKNATPIPPESTPLEGGRSEAKSSPPEVEPDSSCDFRRVRTKYATTESRRLTPERCANMPPLTDTVPSAATTTFLFRETDGEDPEGWVGVEGISFESAAKRYYLLLTEGQNPREHRKFRGRSSVPPEKLFAFLISDGGSEVEMFTVDAEPPKGSLAIQAALPRFSSAVEVLRRFELLRTLDTLREEIASGEVSSVSMVFIHNNKRWPGFFNSIDPRDTPVVLGGHIEVMKELENFQKENRKFRDDQDSINRKDPQKTNEN